MAKPESSLMLSDTALVNDRVIVMPQNGTSVVINPEPGAYTQFLFKLDQVSAVNLRPDGQLEMKLANNSTMVIANFQDLVNSAQSCGRDTILQFVTDKQFADGTTVPKILNIAPDVLAATLDPALANSNTVTVHQPGPGTTREVVMTPGKTYQMDFDWKGAAKTVDGTNLLLSFKNGGLVILRDYVPVMNGDLPPALTLKDGTAVDTKGMLATACTPTGEPLVVAAAPQTKLRAPDVEPAAGTPAKKPVAQAVADIEPAAGDGAGAISGGRGGSGFSSGIDAAVLAGLNPLGPLGPTALVYGLPGVADVPVLRGVDAAPLPPVTPPMAQPTLVVQDECVPEDGAVTLRVVSSAPAGADLVVTISGFAPGWTVENGVGSYDAATGVWTVNVPRGQTFDGGPVVRPPANSDVDLGALTVRAVATDTTTGETSSRSATMTVDTDAVADTPNLTVGTNIVADEGQVIPLAIASSLIDTDGSEVLSLRISGVPTGAVLSAGTVQPDGSWVLTPAQLNGLTVTPANGYSGLFTLTVTATATETNLSGEECDLTNNVATTQNTINVRVIAAPDGVPVIGDSLCETDESFLNTGVISLSGTYTYDYGVDGAGTIALSSFTSSGSLAAGALTSHGVPVVVTQSGNTYIGRAGSETVFTMIVNTNGTYAFNLYKPLDHAAGNNANDVITLDFGVRITDRDGDADVGILRVNVADDAPGAVDDTASSNAGGVAVGNVLTNDFVGQDRPATVTQVSVNNVVYTVPANGAVTVNAAFGTLVMRADGSYTYTGKNGANGGDVFTYTMRDYDGDTSTAQLSIGTSDGVPVIGDGTGSVDETNLWDGQQIVTGKLVSNYGADGAGAITAQGASSFSATGSLAHGSLTLWGLPVAVKLVGNTYVGQVTEPVYGTVHDVFSMTINADGSYRFNLSNSLDHADGNNPNDIITLNFGVRITDKDGDSDTGVISINVLDDAPIARDDTATAVPLQTISGMLFQNDYHSYDEMWIRSVTVNGVTVQLASNPAYSTTIEGLYGVFVINSAGEYTYTAKGSVTGSDILTYTVVDGDGDASTARLTVGVENGVPVIGNPTHNVDESSNLPFSVTGELGAAFGPDGAGAIRILPNSFDPFGSMKNNALTSNGVAVTVTSNGNLFTGTAGSVVVFTLAIAANGTYTYTQYKTLDHANASDPNDIISLSFGVEITDRDGDRDTGTVTIRVADAAPTARDDTYTATPGTNAGGNILGNDTLAEGAVLTTVTYKGQTYVIGGAPVTIDADHGQLTIERDGDYVYRPYAPTSEQVYLNANAGDVAAANDPSITKSGVTITAINPNSGQTLGDLTWVYGDLNIDDTWYGEYGIGVAGGSNKFVDGKNEALRVAFDAPTQDVVLYIGAFNSFSDDWDNPEPYLHARVYLAGQTQPTEIILEQGNYSGYGFANYHLTSAQFGGQAITKIEIYSTDAKTDWTLCNVEYTTTTGGGTDTFAYTIVDQDGDASSAFLRATNTAPAAVAVTSPLAVDDSVTLAINDYVYATSGVNSVTDSSTLDRSVPLMIALIDDQDQQMAA